MPRNRRVSIPDATCCIAGRLSQSLQQSAQRLDCALIDRRPTGCLWGAKVAVCLFQRRMTNQDRIGAALLEGTQSRLRIRSAEQAIAVTENSTQVAGHQLVVANRHECSGEHCPRRRKRCVTWHSSSFPWPKAPKTHGAQDPWRSRPMALRKSSDFPIGHSPRHPPGHAVHSCRRLAQRISIRVGLHMYLNGSIPTINRAERAEVP